MGKKSRRRDNKNTAAAPSTQRGQQRHHQQFDTVVSLLTGDALANPYVVKRDDFRRLPRWPNDGIEQERKKNLKGGPDSLGRIETDDPDTIAMTELLGGYPSKSPLCEIEPKGAWPPGFIRSQPFTFQHEVARQQSDLSSAKTHLIEAYKRKDSDVRRILEEINCMHCVYKGSCDESRFPDFQAILVPLFQKNLASDENIELLFGKVSFVRHLLLDVGSQLADPPPLNSPAWAVLSQYLYNPEMDAAPAPKSCAECGLVSEDSCSKCAGCKSVSYCSQDCQRKHWSIHKPDCLRAQGKKVSEKVAAKAQKEMEERVELERKRNDQKREQETKEVMEIFTSYEEEQPKLGGHWAHDCNDKRLQIYVPSEYAVQIIGDIGKRFLDLRQVQILSLGMYPDGIDPNRYGYRGIEFVDPSNDAHILILFKRLFSNGGDVGLHIDGVFVVEKVVKGRAQWVLIPEPTASYASDDNRLAKLVKHLKLAKEKAKRVPQTVDLGIHNPGDPDLSMMATQFGKFVSVD